MTLAPNSVMVRFTEEDLKWWFFSLFESPIGISFLKEISNSTAQGKFNKTDFKKIIIPIPPLNEQYRIIRKLEELKNPLSTIDINLENLRTLNISMGTLLQQSILQEAIQGRLVPQIESEGTANELLEEIRAEKQRLVKEGKLKKSAIASESRIFRGDDNKYYEQIEKSICELECSFPNSWHVLKLKDICQLTDGEKRTDSHICMDAKYLRGKSSGKYLTKGKFVNKGEEIILVDGENSGEVFTAPIDGYMGSTFKHLWISSAVNKQYVLLYILFNKENLRNSKRGAAIPHLNKNIFYNLIIGIPPINEQERVVRRVKYLFDQLI